MTRVDESGEYLRLRYYVVRLWQLPTEPLLQGPVGTLPLALLTDEARQQLPHLVQRVQQRLEQEKVASKLAGEIWTASEILLGLRYDREEIHRVFQGVAGMEESVIYQEILEKGMAQGKAQGMAQGVIEERHNVLLRLGPERFGKPTKKIVSTIRSIDDPARLERMQMRMLKAKDWRDLLNTP